MRRALVSSITMLFLFCLPLMSWESHYLLTYEALRTMTGLSEEKNVAVETLADFVRQEKKALGIVLQQTELLSAQNLLHYPQLPKELLFTGADKEGSDLVKQFLMSLRVNPDIGFPLFVLIDRQKNNEVEQHGFSEEELKAAPYKTLTELDDGLALKKITAGQKLSPREIIATASEEPDHGMDFYLWQDNNSWFGALYNFGNQPFGNPLLSFGSQAPFHMGFFHESSLLYFFGDFLRRCYPEYRINQFMALSRFAFASKHPYWGYRFLGLANHYIQDLTQSYHARVAPEISTIKLIGINLLAMIGIGGPKRDTTQLLSNRHLGLENYQLGNIKAALTNPSTPSPIIRALQDQQDDHKYGSFSVNYARMVIAKDAFAKASTLDTLVKNSLPSRLNDAKFNFDGHDQGVNLFAEVNASSQANAASLDEVFLSLMRAYGAHTRQSVRHALDIF